MLISKEYRAQQALMHKHLPGYGKASESMAPLVTKIIDQLGSKELLDYGCGKGRLAQSITPAHALEITQYDPAIEEVSDSPEPSELVCCIDVLEHIEPELLDNVLDDLRRVTIKHGLFSIHTGPAQKTLPDGRNAHLIQEPYEWWLPKLWSRFHIHSLTHHQHGFYVVVQRLEVKDGAQ